MAHYPAVCEWDEILTNKPFLSIPYTRSGGLRRVLGQSGGHGSEGPLDLGMYVNRQQASYSVMELAKVVRMISLTSHAAPKDSSVNRRIKTV